MSGDNETGRTSMDPKIVALMTGELGDNYRLSRQSSEFGQAFATVLPGLIRDENGVEFQMAYAGLASGRFSDLVASLDEFSIVSDGTIKGWPGAFLIALPTIPVIAMVETLLGGAADSIVEPPARKASRIELKMSQMIIDRIAHVIRMAVDIPPSVEPQMARAVNVDERPEPEPDAPDPFSTEIRVAMNYGPISATFSVIVPQKTLLKTTVRQPKARTAPKAAEVNEQMAEQVRRSDVRIEARIALEPLTLGILSKLQAGDVIPFRDKQDVKVGVNANGKELYVAEFGRAGENYTVRVKDTHGSESDIMAHLMG